MEVASVIVIPLQIQVDHRVSQVLLKMGRFQRNIKCETRAVAKSSYGVTCYILLGYGTPGSMFSVQVSGDEDVILVSEEMVKFMDEDGFSR
ncbi:hypothetical protein TNIN_476921 [Trichonephila inaurata madagascariensis]|uniref:Uncharacterized protein n=1 Tax=Trichonephila inaurata madagascariensis TaxID=2747483 RepID=A0A8X7BSI9_9ARAC|nr:hypothetical protein TNIN_476921 [Trichonephila inaurata madagascariensis]